MIRSPLFFARTARELFFSRITRRQQPASMFMMLKAECAAPPAQCGRTLTAQPEIFPGGGRTIYEEDNRVFVRPCVYHSRFRGFKQGRPERAAGQGPCHCQRTVEYA